MAVIGIDLGTTNSLAAYYRDGKPFIIPNVYGEVLTPSVVSVDEETGEIYVGLIAKERLLTHPEHTAAVFKRNMGSKKEYTLGGQHFTPEDLSSLVIRKLKEDAEAFIGETVDEAVISVPAYFNDAQRRATKAAGELAGLKIERIVNEPTAAAVAYGLHDKQDYTKYLVFDLGGGTFDVSILEKYEQVMEVRAVAGDNYLGGEDFTDVLLQIFARHHTLEPETLTRPALAALRKSAETAKRSFIDTRSVEMTFTLNSEQLSLTVTADEYEKNCEILFNRLRNPIKRALSDASIRLSDIEAVLLVGGATRLPAVRNFVSKLLGRFPASGVNPDEAVALGAAIHAAMKRRDRSLTEVVLTDVCPYTLGTNISIQRANGFYESGHFCPIIERNAVIPVSRSERLYTIHDNQRIINIEILQGESRKATENVWLGELNIPVPQNKGGREAVDVRYTYDINGILEVEVTVASTGSKKTLVIEKNPGVMTTEEIADRLKDLQTLKIHPRERDEYRYLLARGERMYAESIGDTRKWLERAMQVFEDALDGQDDRVIRTQAVQLRELLDEIDANREY